MRRVLLLTKIQILGMFGFLNRRKKNNASAFTKAHRGGKAATAVLLLFLAAVIVFAVVATNIGMALAITALEGDLSALLGTMVMMGTLLIFFSTFSQINGKLFNFNDYDITMSLPVRSSEVVASKLLSIYIINLLYTVLIMLPAGGVYAYFASPGALFYVYYIIALLFAPLAPQMIATVLGALFTFLAAKYKWAKFLAVFFYVVLVAGLFFLSFAAQTGSEAQLAGGVSKIYDGIGKFYPFVVWLVKGTAEGRLIYLALFCFIPAAVFVLLSVLIGYRFKAINTSLMSIGGKKKKGPLFIEQGSPFSALLKREFKRYFSVMVYLLNTVIGGIMAVLLCIVFVFLMPQIPGAEEIMTYVLPPVICTMLGIAPTTSSSISLEGKNLWLLKSLPVKTGEIFKSKMFLNIIIMAPFCLISSLIFVIGLNPHPGIAVAGFLMPLAYLFTMTLLGLIVNLKKPKFNWQTEVNAVKQSAAIVYTMLISFAYDIVLILGTIFLCIWISWPGALIMTAVTALIGVGLLIYLKRRGERLFNKLQENG